MTPTKLQFLRADVESLTFFLLFLRGRELSLSHFSIRDPESALICDKVLVWFVCCFSPLSLTTSLHLPSSDIGTCFSLFNACISTITQTCVPLGKQVALNTMHVISLSGISLSILFCTLFLYSLLCFGDLSMLPYANLAHFF